MFELTRRYEFHAARKLTLLDLDHPCSQLHGHTFSLVIELSGDIDRSKGWVIDFFDIDTIYKEEIYKLLELTNQKALNILLVSHNSISRCLI